MGTVALVLLRREGLLAANVTVAIAIVVGLPGLALLAAPRQTLRSVVRLLSAVVGIACPITFWGAANDYAGSWFRFVQAWLALSAPLLVLLWARYRFLRRPISRTEA